MYSELVAFGFQYFFFSFFFLLVLKFFHLSISMICQVMSGPILIATCYFVINSLCKFQRRKQMLNEIDTVTIFIIIN